MIFLCLDIGVAFGEVGGIRLDVPEKGVWVLLG